MDAREGVKALISSRMADLHALAQALIDRETLTAEQIHTVLATGQLPDVPPSGGGGGGSGAEPGSGGAGGGGGSGGEDRKVRCGGALARTRTAAVPVVSSPGLASEEEGGAERDGGGVGREG